MVIWLPPDFHKNGYKKSAWICSYPCARWLVFGFARVHISRFRQNRRFSSVILPLLFSAVKTAKTPIKSGFSVGASILCNPFGGGGRIRTIEAIRSRFTVCPLWPLGNSPIWSLLWWVYLRLEPVDGLDQSRCGSVKPSPATLVRVAFNCSSLYCAYALMEPVDGLEPPTCWLQISCSTNWAIPAAQTEHAYYSDEHAICQELFAFFAKNQGCEERVDFFEKSTIKIRKNVIYWRK